MASLLRLSLHSLRLSKILYGIKGWLAHKKNGNYPCKYGEK